MERKSLWEHGPLRGLIKTVPATSFVALLIIIGGLAIVSEIIVVYGQDATTRTQVLTGVFGLLGLVAGFYFTNQLGKKDKDSKPENDNHEST